MVLSLVGGLGTWSATAPLSSAALAPGVVAVDTKRKTVQHLEGGIVSRILVREGERVAPASRWSASTPPRPRSAGTWRAASSGPSGRSKPG